MNINPSPGNEPPHPGLNKINSSQDLHVAVAKIERLAYTEAANVQPAKDKPSPRLQALRKAMYYWVHSRF